MPRPGPTLCSTQLPVLSLSNVDIFGARLLGREILHIKIEREPPKWPMQLPEYHQLVAAPGQILCTSSPVSNMSISKMLTQIPIHRKLVPTQDLEVCHS